jgi:hypothetical protein
MAKTVEIPDDLHLGAIVKRPLDEILDEVLAEPPVHLGSSTADLIRELRGPLPATDDDRR